MQASERARPEAPKGKVLRVGLLTPIPGLDPRRSLDRLSSLAVTQIFETPFRLPAGAGPAEPWLFDGPLCSEDEDGMVLSAGVRSGIRFSDGTDLTVRHVVDSLRGIEAIVDEAEIEARDDRVFFSLKSPNPRFDLALTLKHCSVVLETGDQLLGTGPFVPDPGSSMEALRLIPNPYYREPVRLEAIEFRVFPASEKGRPEALMAALEREEIDFTNVLSRSDVTNVHGYRKAFQPSNSTAILFLNTTSAPLDRVGLRRAVARAIDKRRLTEISYTNVLAFMATCILPPMMGAGSERVAFDLAAARRDLEESGGPPERPLRLLEVWAPRPYLPYPGPVSELIVRQLGRLGVEVVLERPRDAEEYFERQREGDYDLVLGGWIADNADPTEFLEALLLSDRIPVSGERGVSRCNLARIRSEELDRALADYRRSPAPKQRERVLDLVAREVPLVPLMYGPTILVHSWRLRNVEVSPLGEPHFASIVIAD